MKQKRQLEDQISQLLGQLVGLSKFPDQDPCQDGDAIWFEKKFPNDDTLWVYVAIRAGNGRWYTTSQSGRNHFSNWDELCSWMGKGVDKVYMLRRDPEPFIDAATTKTEFFAEMRRQMAGGETTE